MFTIEADEKAAILHLKLTGFWTPDTVRDFVVALAPVVERLQRRCATYSVLSDSRGWPGAQNPPSPSPAPRGARAAPRRGPPPPDGTPPPPPRWARERRLNH